MTIGAALDVLAATQETIGAPKRVYRLPPAPREAVEAPCWINAPELGPVEDAIGMRTTTWSIVMRYYGTPIADKARYDDIFDVVEAAVSALSGKNLDGVVAYARVVSGVGPGIMSIGSAGNAIECVGFELRLETRIITGR